MHECIGSMNGRTWSIVSWELFLEDSHNHSKPPQDLELVCEQQAEKRKEEIIEMNEDFKNQRLELINEYQRKLSYEYEKQDQISEKLKASEDQSSR